MRVLLGGVAAALALTFAPHASATHSPACAEEIQIVCDVINLVDGLVCVPKFHAC